MKILIAEDETFMRKSFVNIIKKSNEDFEIVYEASNGKQAYEKYLKFKPDVVITDIKMPIMDGLKLSEKIRKIDKNVYIIILSCYDDFSYAKKAIASKVNDYFLKMETPPEELIDKLKSIKIELEKRIEKKSYESDILKDHKSKESLHKFFLNASISEECAKRLIEENNLQINFDKYIISSIKISKRNEWIEKNSYQTVELIDFGVLNIINEILSNHKKSFAYKKENGSYVCFISQFDTTQTLTKKLINPILFNLNKAFDLDFYCGLSNIHSSFDERFKAIKESDFASKMFFWNHNEKVFLYQKSRPNTELKLSVDEKLLRQHIETYDYQWIEKYIKKIFSPLSSNNSTEGKVRTFAVNLLLKISNIALSDKEEGAGSYSDLIEEVNRFTSLDKIIFWTLNTVNKILRDKKEFIEELKDDNLINEIKSYISKNYQRNLSLTDTASYFNYNPCYMSILFKKKLKMTYIDYLTHVRIENAKRYLKQDNLPVNKVCKLSGYSNPQYFSKVFKKHTGLTPSEYVK